MEHTNIHIHTHSEIQISVITGSSVHGDIPFPWAVIDSLSSKLGMTESLLSLHTHTTHKTHCIS